MDLAYSYDVAVTNVGDVFVYGSIIGSQGEVGSSTYYAALSEGSGTGDAYIASDVVGTANNGLWTIEFNRNTEALSVLYKDQDVSGGQTSFVGKAGDCVTQTY